MQSLSGNGYSLTLADSAMDITCMGVGMAFVHSGTWVIGGHTLLPGNAIETTGPAMINSGYGLLACAALNLKFTVGETIGGFEHVHRRDMQRHDKPWGYEYEVMGLAHDLQLKLLHVLPGHRTSLQFHRQKDEVQIFIDDHRTGKYYPPGVHHRVTGPAWYYEASTYHPTDVVRVEDDYHRG